MTEHVFVTRHGARIDNGPDADRGWLSKAGHVRRDDPHLSSSGKIAAEELAAALANGGVFAYTHTRQTSRAQITAARQPPTTPKATTHDHEQRVPPAALRPPHSP